MTGASLNIMFGPTSAPPSSGAVNSVVESSHAGCFGEICQAIVSQQSSNSVLPLSSSSNADVSESATSTNNPVTQPQIKQKEPDVSEPLLSLGAMLGTPTLIVLGQIPFPDTSAADGVPLTQLNVENAPDTRSDVFASDSSSIKSGSDSPILSSLSANASSSSLFSSVLNTWSAPPLVPETCTPPGRLSKDDQSVADIDAPFNQDLFGSGNSAIQNSEPAAVASEKPPTIEESTILANDVVAAPQLKSDGRPESDLPLEVLTILPGQSTNIQSARPESRIDVESDSVKASTGFQRATLSGEGATALASKRPDTLQTSNHQNDGRLHLVGGLPKVKNAAGSLSFGMELQAAPAGHPAQSSLPSTDSQGSLSAPSLIQAAIQTSTGNSPAGPGHTTYDVSIREPDPEEEVDQSASRSSLAPVSVTGADSSPEFVTKNPRNDAADNQKHNDEAVDVSSTPSLAPAPNPPSIVTPAESGTATPNGNASKSPSPEKSVDDRASYHHFDLPLSAASSAGPVQLAQILNKASHSEMRIGLNTAAFGDVEIRTIVHATNVGVQIGSEKGNLQALLTNDLPTISGHLQQQNLHLSQVSFQATGFGSHSGSSQQHDTLNRRPMMVQPHSEHTSNPESAQDEVSGTPQVRGVSSLSVLA